MEAHTATKTENDRNTLMIVLGGNKSENGYALDLETMEWQKLKDVSYIRQWHTAHGLG